MARRRLIGTLDEWGLNQVSEASALVLTDLLTNAVRHGRVRGRVVETRFVRVPGGLRIEVHDASEKRPMMALPDDGAEGGWGLPLVDVLSARWGVSDRPAPGAVGKLVWAELVVGPEGDAT